MPGSSVVVVCLTASLLGLASARFDHSLVSAQACTLVVFAAAGLGQFSVEVVVSLVFGQTAAKAAVGESVVVGQQPITVFVIFAKPFGMAVLAVAVEA